MDENSKTAPFEPQPIPKGLIPPIDMSRAKKEEHVKAKVKALLNAYGWFTWMPPANGYGTSGVHDHNALKNGVFLTVESKFGYNKPTPLQCAFGAQIIANAGFSFCVNERNIDWLAYWLESFEIATQEQVAGRDVPPEHGSRMLNAIEMLTLPFSGVQARVKSGE